MDTKLQEKPISLMISNYNINGFIYWAAYSTHLSYANPRGVRICGLLRIFYTSYVSFPRISLNIVACLFLNMYVPDRICCDIGSPNQYAQLILVNELSC